MDNSPEIMPIRSQSFLKDLAVITVSVLNPSPSEGTYMTRPALVHASRSFTSPPGTPLPLSAVDPTRPAMTNRPTLPSLATAMHVKRVTLTSKKNWWMVEMDEEDDSNLHAHAHTHPHEPSHSFLQAEEVASGSPFPLPHHPHPEHYPLQEHVFRQDSHRHQDLFTHPEHHHAHAERALTPPPSPPVYNPPRHPTSIFSFPTPTAYAAPPNPTASLTPCAQGSASELFKCIVKKPDVIQLEINGEMQSNATDVTTQFLAELRVYTTIPRHRNIAAFLGCLENVGMVLEFIEGRTLYDVICERPMISKDKKIDFHNQLLDGLTHLHAYGLSHGDLSLLNVQVTVPSDTIKLLDFGRSVHADSTFIAPDDDPVDPFPVNKSSGRSLPTVEQIHPGTRPFSAPEILRGECQDPCLADAYSFGMILVALDRCESVDAKPWEQRKDMLPKDLFDGCTVFEERAKWYLRKWDQRRRLTREDMIAVEQWMASI